MTTLDWPDNAGFHTVSMYIETLTVVNYAGYTPVADVLSRPAERWAAQVSFQGTRESAGQIDALAARLRGGVNTVLVPDYIHSGSAGNPQSFSDYADEIGETFWDDSTSWDDDTQWFEGEGEPTLLGGRKDRVVVGGYYPFATGLVVAGDGIQTWPGEAVILTDNYTPAEEVVSDKDGKAIFSCAPILREPIQRGPLLTEAIYIRMRLRNDDSISQKTVPPLTTTWTFNLVEFIERRPRGICGCDHG